MFLDLSIRIAIKSMNPRILHDELNKQGFITLKLSLTLVFIILLLFLFSLFPKSHLNSNPQIKLI